MRPFKMIAIGLLAWPVAEIAAFLFVATFVGVHPCAPGAAWLKLRALVEGARLASSRL